MGRRTFVVVLILGVLLVLPPLAHASPTDPTWIPGFYDDNDYDDVILFITGAVTAVDSRIVGAIAVVAVCLGLIAPTRRPLVPVSSPADLVAQPSRLAPYVAPGS